MASRLVSGHPVGISPMIFRISRCGCPWHLTVGYFNSSLATEN
jgi:hypothetical protein